MPRLSRWFVRASFGYLVLGVTLGAVLLVQKAWVPSAAAWALRAAHVEFLLFGWTVQLVLGVAFWILPRFLTGPERGAEGGAWLAFVLLNAGIWLVSLAPVVGLTGWTLAGRVLERAAVLAFVTHAWPRVRASLAVHLNG